MNNIMNTNLTKISEDKMKVWLEVTRKVHNQIYEDQIIGFEKFKEQHDQVYIDNFSYYIESFEGFSKKHKILLDEKHKMNEQEAWSFSLFEIIKVRRKEEDLHSPLLAELLNTNGTHGQKDLFYKLFLKEVVGTDNVYRFINDNYHDYSIKCEEYIRNTIGNGIKDEKGEIDITIKSTNRKNKFAIILENKWGSGDSCPDQLFKYYRNFTNPQGKAYTDENLLIIYLTKYGGNPRWIENEEFKLFLQNNIRKNYFPISYKVEIRKWLEACILNCKSKKINIIIEQYLNTIKYGINN